MSTWIIRFLWLAAIGMVVGAIWTGDGRYFSTGGILALVALATYATVESKKHPGRDWRMDRQNRKAAPYLKLNEVEEPHPEERGWSSDHGQWIEPERGPGRTEEGDPSGR